MQDDPPPKRLTSKSGTLLTAVYSAAGGWGITLKDWYSWQICSQLVKNTNFFKENWKFEEERIWIWEMGWKYILRPLLSGLLMREYKIIHVLDWRHVDLYVDLHVDLCMSRKNLQSLTKNAPLFPHANTHTKYPLPMHTNPHHHDHIHEHPPLHTDIPHTHSLIMNTRDQWYSGVKLKGWGITQY